MLVGPAGAGRTALLMTLAGRMKPMGGSLDVLGRTRAPDIFGCSALAGFEEIDGVSESVTVRDLVTEQMRWDAAWYRLIRRAGPDDVARVCGPVFGPLPLPEPTVYVDQLTELDAMLLRIALANTSTPPLLVVGSLDQVDDDRSRAELVRRLVALGENQTVVTASANPVPDGLGVRAQVPVIHDQKGRLTMLAGMSLGTDLKRYSRGVLPRVALITIILLPLLYGAMYLWAFWNPFAAVDRVPVALVNEDRGALAQGQELRAGDEVAGALLKSGQLDLHLVSAEAAAKAVADGTYYFSITLPEDFSEAIASSATPNPRQAQIQFDYNDANNYLASVIGQNAAREVLNQVGARVGEQVVGKVLIGLTDAGEGIKKAADGADRLSAGLTAANDGAHQLSSGADTLAAGLVTARNGSAALAAGADQLSSGIGVATGPLIDALDRVQRLNLNPDDVAALAARISSGVATASDRIAELNVDHQLAAGIVDQVVGGLQANADPSARGLGEVLEGAQKLLNSQGLDPTTDDGLVRLRDGARQTRDRVRGHEQPDAAVAHPDAERSAEVGRPAAPRWRRPTRQRCEETQCGAGETLRWRSAVGERRTPVGRRHPEARRRVPRAGRRA